MTSPALAAVAAGETSTAELWERLRVVGGPLVEEIPEEPDFRLVTFVWRDDGTEVDSVLVNGGLTPLSVDGVDHLTRLAGSGLWHRTYRVRADLRVEYQFVLTPSAGQERQRRRDPLNANCFSWPTNDVYPSFTACEYSVLELAGASPQTWVAPRPDLPAGRLTAHRLASKRLGNERRVWTYTPSPDIAGGAQPAGRLVLLDGWAWAELFPIVTTLDNLIAAGEIPPIAAVLPEALDFPTRVRELGCHDPFVAFLTDELLPWLSTHVDVPDDPERTVIAGQSLGGVTACYAALTRPDVFGTVISQSGAFMWKYVSEFDLDAEWLPRQYAVRPRVPVRFYVEAGLTELPGILPVNRHFRNILDAKGYDDVVYREYNGGHHWLNWRVSLAEALRIMLSR